MRPSVICHSMCGLGQESDIIFGLDIPGQDWSEYITTNCDNLKLENMSFSNNCVHWSFKSYFTCNLNWINHKTQAASIKNWKIDHSKIIAFTWISKLTDTSLRKTTDPFKLETTHRMVQNVDGMRKQYWIQFFLMKNVRYLEWTCRDLKYFWLNFIDISLDNFLWF